MTVNNITRSSWHFHILLSQQVLHSFNIVNTGPCLWNLLSDELKSARSLAVFKSHNKKHLILLYSSTFIVSLVSDSLESVGFSFVCVCVCGCVHMYNIIILYVASMVNVYTYQYCVHLLSLYTLTPPPLICILTVLTWKA